MSIGIKYGSGMVALNDAGIKKQNRLFTLRKVHRQWLVKQEQQEGVVEKEETEGKEKQQTEAVMIKKVGDCMQCGREGVTLKKSYGKECCSMCQVVRTSVKNKPAVVRAALMEFHGDEAVESESVLVDRGDLQESIKVWESFYLKLMGVVMPDVDAESVDFYEHRNFLPATVASRFVAYDELRDTLKESDKQVTELTKIVTMSDPKSERRDQVLDIALAVIRNEGHVVADQLEMLRHDGVA